MQADALSQTFAALADPTRRAILKRLTAGPANVKELSRPFDMSGPAVRKHLRVLDACGPGPAPSSLVAYLERRTSWDS